MSISPAPDLLLVARLPELAPRVADGPDAEGRWRASGRLEPEFGWALRLLEEVDAA